MKTELDRAIALGANCSQCSFNSCKGPVYFKTKTEDPKFNFDVTVVADFDFDGRYGWLTQGILKENGVKYEQVHWTNSILCNPEAFVDKRDFTNAINNCRPRLANEIPPNKDRRQLVFLMGERALQSVTGKTGIKSWRGFPIQPLELFDRENTIYFPVHHPKIILGAPAYAQIWKLDFARAIQYMQGKLHPIKWPKTFVDEDETSHDALYQILKQVEKEKTDLGLDVETAGKEPLLVDLLCIGIAISDLAVCLPFRSAGKDTLELWNKILSHRNVCNVCHNGQHDILSLRAHGINCELGFDTLSAARSAFPKIDKDLGTCMTLAMFCPRHKSEYHKSGDLDTKGENAWGKAAKDPKKFRDMRIYCARDSWGGLMIKPFLEKIGANK